MNTRANSAAQFSAPKNDQNGPASLAQNHAASPAYAKSGLKQETFPSLHELVEEGKEERRENFSAATQVALNVSYKAQKSKFSPEASPGVAQKALWENAKALLAYELGEPAVATWMESCQGETLENSTFTLRTDSEFTRNQLLKRYSATICRVLKQLTGQEIRLNVVVREPQQVVSSPQMDTLPHANMPARPEKSPWAMQQNPTNNPEIALLLERYGDLRGVVLNSPLFKAPCTRLEEGGWGIGVGAMIQAGKEYTLERLIWAMRHVKEYRGANDRGKFFYHVLRKGLEGQKCS